MQPTFSFIYSIPYLILFFIFFMMFLWENRIKRKNGNITVIRYLCMIVFVVFFGCRGYIDTDFMLYMPLYELSPTIDDSAGIAKFFSGINEDYILKIEPGFKVFMVLLKSISPDYFFLQFVSSLIDVLFLNYFFKKYSPQYVLGFIAFLIFTGFIVEFNLLRNSKAIFIFIYSLQFIKERKAAKFFICNSIGLLFHSSAIFYFPLYFFLHKKITPGIVWGTFLLGNFLFIAQIKYITPVVTAVGSMLGGAYNIMVEAYSDDKFTSSGYGITIGYLEKLLSFILFYKFYKKIGDYIKDNVTVNIFFNLFFLYTVSYLFLSEYSVFTDRITTLFVFSYWIMYPMLYATLERGLKTLFTFVMLLFGSYKMYKSNNMIIRNYENFLWNKPSVSRAYAVINKHLDSILNPKKTK